MARTEMDSLAALDGDVVELTVPAQTPYLAVVRTATAGLAARLGFTLDEVEDLRIAVDEACAMLLTLPQPPSPGAEPATLGCHFRVLTDGIAVTVSVSDVGCARLPAEHSFAWQVLTAHASDVRGIVRNRQASIELVKRRMEQ